MKILCYFLCFTYHGVCKGELPALELLLLVVVQGRLLIASVWLRLTIIHTFFSVMGWIIVLATS